MGQPVQQDRPLLIQRGGLRVFRGTPLWGDHVGSPPSSDRVPRDFAAETPNSFTPRSGYIKLAPMRVGPPSCPTVSEGSDQESRCRRGVIGIRTTAPPVCVLPT